MGRRVRIAMAVVAAGLLAGCGSSGADAGATTDGAAESVTMAMSSPLGVYLRDDGGFDAAMINYIGLVEEEILLCMREQGFEFRRTERDVPEMQERMSELTVREWTAEYGYGISTWVESFDPTVSEDPNTPIMLQLTNADRELWVEALTGGQPEVGANGMDLRPLEDQGCVGQGFINTGGSNAFEGMQAFGETWDERQAQLLDRPVMVDVLDAWSRCMSEAGYPGFGSLDEPEDQIQEKLDAIQEQVSAAGMALSDEQREAWFNGDESDADPAFFDTGLFELQAEEAELALADLDCYEAEVREVHEPLSHALETELIGEYEDELASLKNLGGE